MTSPKTLRQTLDEGSFVVAPGIPDMISALVANEIGFDFIYGSGYWTTASAHGLPDAGLASSSQMVDRMATLARVSTAQVIADADTGFGGLLNVRQTVRDYEAAGIVAIQIEDQVFPKRCGHTRNKQVVEPLEMMERIAVATAARTNPNTLIIARTDAVAIEGVDSAIERAKRYADAGADILFVEALEDPDEMARVCRAVDRPLMANMADGGFSPILDADTLKDIGYSIAIFPAICALHAAAAVRQALTSLKETGTSQKTGLPMFDFQHFCGLIGFDEIYALDDAWAAQRETLKKKLD